MRKALGNIPHEIPDQYELRRLAAPYFHHRLSGGEGDMLIGKALWAHLHNKAHMICELSPYSCMPNTMSIGAMAGVLGQHPDLLYAPIEVKGDAEVHALSRCQMILTEAKKRAVREYVKVMEKTGLDPEAVRKVLDANPAMRKATYRCSPHGRRRRGRQYDAPRRGSLLREARRMKTVGMDVGSTTIKAVVVEDGQVIWRDYQRHNTKQAEKAIEFLTRMEQELGLTQNRDRIFFTGSGAGLIAPLVGGKLIQEVVAVAATVEKLHPEVRFVSEIGGEDMKTIFFTETAAGKTKQVYMQSACSGGTGTFIEKTARKLRIPSEQLCTMPYDGMSLHKVSSKCGIFAEADANTLLKSGVPVEEIIASLFEAVVYQNLATLTKGNTPLPQRAAARWAEYVLQRPATGLAASPDKSLARPQLSAAARHRSRRSHPRAGRCAVLCGAWGALRSPTARRRAWASIRAPKSSAGGSRKASTRKKRRTGPRLSFTKMTISKVSSRRSLPAAER